MPRRPLRPWPLVPFVLIAWGIVWILVESALMLHAPLLEAR